MDDCVSIREEQRRKLEEQADRERDEIALRFAVAAVSSDIHTYHLQGSAQNIAAWGYQLADAFLAERARQPGAPK